MKKDTHSTYSMPTIEDSIAHNQIKEADLLPDPESRLDSMEMKEKPIGDF